MGERLEGLLRTVVNAPLARTAVRTLARLSDEHQRLEEENSSLKEQLATIAKDRGQERTQAVTEYLLSLHYQGRDPVKSREHLEKAIALGGLDHSGNNKFISRPQQLTLNNVRQWISNDRRTNFHYRVSEEVKEVFLAVDRILPLGGYRTLHLFHETEGWIGVEGLLYSVPADSLVAAYPEIHNVLLEFNVRCSQFLQSHLDLETVVPYDTRKLRELFATTQVPISPACEDFLHAYEAVHKEYALQGYYFDDRSVNNCLIDLTNVAPENVARFIILSPKQYVVPIDWETLREKTDAGHLFADMIAKSPVEVSAEQIALVRSAHDTSGQPFSPVLSEAYRTWRLAEPRYSGRFPFALPRGSALFNELLGVAVEPTPVGIAQGLNVHAQSLSDVLMRGTY